MDVLSRGLQSYLTIVGGVLLLALVWAGNRYLMNSTTAETGWPMLIAVALLLMVLIVGGRHLAARSADRLPFVGRGSKPHDWNSRR